MLYYSNNALVPPPNTRLCQNKGWMNGVRIDFFGNPYKTCGYMISKETWVTVQMLHAFSKYQNGLLFVESIMLKE